MRYASKPRHAAEQELAPGPGVERLLAADEQRVDGAHELVHGDLAIVIGVGGLAVRDGPLSERNVHAAYQLGDSHQPVAVAASCAGACYRCARLFWCRGRAG